jgi:hypothetical protein
MQIQRLGVNSFVQTIRGAFVQQIEPAKDAMRMEEVVKLFSTAFAQVCALKVVDKLVVNSLTHELTTAMLTLGSFFNSSKANWASTRVWFNHSRFRRVIKAHPAALYKCNVINLA